jgi:RNA polymerase sigma-70 factor (ECF subfamily)
LCIYDQHRRKERYTLDEKALIRKVRHGDHAAFKELVTRYESQVAATVIGMLGPGPEADDVGQETFVRFYRAIGRFRGDASVGTYLTRIAINLCINEIKRRSRRRMTFTADGEKSIESIGCSPKNEKRTEAAQLVYRGLQKLDAKYRSVLVLRLIDGYSTRETAAILRLPQGTVLSRLARGQQKLKVLLAPLFKSTNSPSGDGHD